MKKLQNRIKIKKKMFKMYKDELKNIQEIEFVKTDIKKITPWMSDIILKNTKIRLKLIMFLQKNNIETRIFYPSIHKLKPYFTNDKKFPISSEISDRGLWLPSSVTLKEKEIQIISKFIKKFFN